MAQAKITASDIATGVVPASLYDINNYVVEIPVTNPDFASGSLTGWTTGGTPTGASAFMFGLGAVKFDGASDSISQTLGFTSSGVISSGSGRAVKLVFSMFGFCETGGSGVCTQTISFGSSSASLSAAFFSGEASNHTVALSIESVTIGNTVLSVSYLSGTGNMWVSAIRLIAISNSSN